jgi:hypothetical protein
VAPRFAQLQRAAQVALGVLDVLEHDLQLSAQHVENVQGFHLEELG